MRDDELRWSEGMRLRPRDYYKLGQLSAIQPLITREYEMASGPDDDLGLGLDLTGLDPSGDEIADLADVLGEVESEDQALGAWGDGIPTLDELEAEMAALTGREGPRMDDLSGYADALRYLDMSNDDGGSTATGEARQKDIRMTRWTGLARGVLHGDLTAMAEAYAQAGSAGHRAVELAQEYGGSGGSDSRSIELSRYEGRFAHTCSAPDSLGRCSARYHAAECAHNAESAAARGGSPEDAQAWRSALARHGQIPLADSQGRLFAGQSGQAMTASDHIEALSGQRHGESPFLGDRRTRRELASPQRQRVLGDPSADPGSPEASGAEFIRGTAATARALAAQAHLPTSADALRQRQAWTAEHDRRVADRAARTSGRRHPDYAESPAERRERMHQPVALSNASDGEDLFGALPTFTAGSI